MGGDDHDGEDEERNFLFELVQTLAQIGRVEQCGCMKKIETDQRNDGNILSYYFYFAFKVAFEQPVGDQDDDRYSIEGDGIGKRAGDHAQGKKEDFVMNLMPPVDRVVEARPCRYLFQLFKDLSIKVDQVAAFIVPR
jgi:hypothetical protein